MNIPLNILLTIFVKILQAKPDLFLSPIHVFNFILFSFV